MEENPRAVGKVLGVVVGVLGAAMLGVQTVPGPEWFHVLSGIRQRVLMGAATAGLFTSGIGVGAWLTQY